MKTRIVILCVVAVFALSLVVIGAVLKDKKDLDKTTIDNAQPTPFSAEKRDLGEPVTQNATPTEVVEANHRITIPDGVNRIKIFDGRGPGSITVDGEAEIQQFIETLNSVTGVAKIVERSVGFRYGIQFYRGDEMCGSLSFMTETVVLENKGNDDFRDDTLHNHTKRVILHKNPRT